MVAAVEVVEVVVTAFGELTEVVVPAVVAGACAGVAVAADWGKGELGGGADAASAGCPR
jgi:hypothetical protein